MNRPGLRVYPKRRRGPGRLCFWYRAYWNGWPIGGLHRDPNVARGQARHVIDAAGWLWP